MENSQELEIKISSSVIVIGEPLLELLGQGKQGMINETIDKSWNMVYNNSGRKLYVDSIYSDIQKNFHYERGDRVCHEHSQFTRSG